MLYVVIKKKKKYVKDGELRKGNTSNTETYVKEIRQDRELCKGNTSNTETYVKEIRKR